MAYSPLSSLGGSSSSGDHFDPDQPRVPAGQSGGGRWTRLGALLSGRGIDLQGEEKFGPPDQSGEPKLPEDASQLAFSRGSETNTTWRLPPTRQLFKSLPLHPDQAVWWYERYSAFNGPDGQTVLELERKEPRFNSFGFSRGDDAETFVFTHATVKRLTREEVQKKCNQFDTVQKALDGAYDDILRKKPGLDPGRFGSKLHLLMKERVNQQGKPDLRGVVINDAKFGTDRINAERSYMKGQPEPKDEHMHYGELGSRRPDAVENSYGAAVQRLTPDTACIYQHSIGQKNMGLTDTISLLEVMERAFKDNKFKHVIVTQMRPKQWRPGR
jgi:hypothetical protein